MEMIASITSFQIEQFMPSIVVGLWIVAVILFVIFVLVFIYLLALHDLFFTFVEEGKAKAVVINDKFHRLVMAYEGHTFRGLLPEDGKHRDKDGHKWDVVEGESKQTVLKYIFNKLLYPVFGGGLEWVGIPPFAQVYEYKFRWTTLIQQTVADEGGMERTIMLPHTRTDPSKIALIQDFVYVASVIGAETKAPEERLPVDVVVLVTIRGINPYKMLFEAKDWLEVVLAQTEARTRKFIGSNSYDTLLSLSEKEGQEFKRVNLIDELGLRGGENDLDFENKYGIKLQNVQLHSVALCGDLKKEHLEATTMKYVAERKAEAVIVQATAEKKAIDMIYGAVESHPNGPNINTWRSIRDSKLTALSIDGDKLIQTVTVSDHSPKKKDEGGNELSESKK